MVFAAVGPAGHLIRQLSFIRLVAVSNADVAVGGLQDLHRIPQSIAEDCNLLCNDVDCPASPAVHTFDQQALQ